MSGTARGGATVRRVPGLAGAEGGWDTEAVGHGLAALVRRRDELAPRFEELAARLADTRERLAGGLPPEPRLDAELASARSAFGRLHADARALAEALDIALPQQAGAPALHDVTAVLDAIHDGLRAELDRQARWAAAWRDTALAVLNRVDRITYRGPSDAAGADAIRAWRARARGLGEAISATEPPALHPEVAPLCDGGHPFSHLLDLIDGLPTLDEPEYRRLVNAVAAGLDEPLARAAGRGLLVADQA